MICGNCGFQNAPGDEFCGSCGQFLAWTGPDDKSSGTAPAGATGAPGPGAAGPASAGLPQPDEATAFVPPPDPPVDPEKSGPDGSVIPDSGPNPVTGWSTTSGPPPPPPPPLNGPLSGVPTGGSPSPTESPAWQPNIQRCDVCGTANETGRTFCMNCGAQLKKAGTVGGYTAAAARARGTTNKRPLLYVVGALVLVLLFAAGVFVVLGGLGGSPRSTPGGPSAVAAASSGSSAAPGSPSASTPVIVPGSGAPSQTATSAQPTSTAVATAPTDPTATPTSAPQTTPIVGFTCAAQHLDAGGPGGWKVSGLSSQRHLKYDQVTISLSQQAGADTGALDATLMSLDQVEPTTGLLAPSGGDIALVLSFNDAVSAPLITIVPATRAVHDVTSSHANGNAYVVMGINGAGCYTITPTNWTSGTGTAQLDIGVQH